MGSVPYRPGSQAGFEKLSGNKYMAPIHAIMPTQPHQDDRLGTLGLPESIMQLLEDEGYLRDRARIAPMEEETLGQYNGVPARIETVDGLEYGVVVPDYAATATEEVTIHGRNGAYLIEEDEREPRKVCITFADDDIPLSLDALEYEKLGEDDGFSGYWDRRDETYVIQ
jgi:hypothetical protein